MPTLTHPASAPAPSPVPADPLAGLRDIHLPTEISGFPVAPGWWLLAALVITALIVGAILYQRRRQRNQYRREALALLAQQMSAEGVDPSAAEKLQNINNLLKRVALVAYPHTAVARYYGLDWAHFLRQAAPALAQPAKLPDILSAGLYAAPSRQEGSVAVFHDYAQSWINRHVPEAKLNLQAEAKHAAL